MNTNFSEVTVLVIGDMMLDKYIYDSLNRTSPEADVPVVLELNENVYAGGAANVAMNVNALGAKVIPVGIVGNDMSSSALISLLRKENIDTGSIVKSDSVHTTTKKRIFINDKQYIRLDRDSSISDDRIYDLLCVEIENNIKKSDVIIISDYNKGVVSKNICQFTINLANKMDIPVVVDPKKEKFDYYSRATAITPNLDEASLVANTKNIDELIFFFQKEIDRINVDYFLLKLGKEGIILIKKNETKKFVAREVKYPDVTGAGDTVISTLSLMIAVGNKIESCVEYANIAAGKVVEKKETAFITKKEIFNL